MKSVSIRESRSDRFVTQLARGDGYFNLRCLFRIQTKTSSFKTQREKENREGKNSFFLSYLFNGHC